MRLRLCLCNSYKLEKSQLNMILPGSLYFIPSLQMQTQSREQHFYVFKRKLTYSRLNDLTNIFQLSVCLSHFRSICKITLIFFLGDYFKVLKNIILSPLKRREYCMNHCRLDIISMWYFLH